MKLTSKAICAIRESMKLRNRLSLELNKHYSTILRMLDINAPNGMLTTVRCLQLIEEETGLAQKEILMEEKSAA